MSLTLFYVHETAPAYVKPWHWNMAPAPGYYGNGRIYDMSLRVAHGYVPTFGGGYPVSDSTACPVLCIDSTPSKLTRSNGGWWLLVPCDPSEDEAILLITTIHGDHNEEYFKSIGCEILRHNASYLRPDFTTHILARLTQPDGLVYNPVATPGFGLVRMFRPGNYSISTVAEFKQTVEGGSVSY